MLQFAATGRCLILVAGLLVASPISLRAQVGMMDYETFLKHCKDKASLCQMTLEAFVSGLANGATNAARTANRPAAAAPYQSSKCNEMVSQWRGDQLVELFLRFAESFPVDSTAKAPHLLVVGTFALSKACIPN